MKILRLTPGTQADILENLLKRSPNSYETYEKRVSEIIADVREKRDEAVFAYTKKFDGADIHAGNIRVTEEEIAGAYEKVDQKLLRVMRSALVNIRSYHEKQRSNSWFDTKEAGIILGQKITPLERAGVYVPGGRAVYPSSVLMNVIPAKVAGVDEIIMTTPPGADGRVNPSTLVAAKEAGADAVYKVGGAQAVAAMAFGTQSIPKVDKIVGPGNIYVALAKKAKFNLVVGNIIGSNIFNLFIISIIDLLYVSASLYITNHSQTKILLLFGFIATVLIAILLIIKNSNKKLKIVYLVLSLAIILIYIAYLILSL